MPGYLPGLACGVVAGGAMFLPSTSNTVPGAPGCMVGADTGVLSGIPGAARSQLND